MSKNTVKTSGLATYARLIMLGACLTAPTLANAETTDFGGYPERFKGAGDRIPPRCQIEVPRASAEPFFVKWNCTDDNAEPSDIRTEVWIYRKGAPTGALLQNFLGFPAAVRIDESVLETATFKDGLPVSVKLLAKDRAGNVTISPILQVNAQDNSVDTCTLKIVTEETESSGSTTGVPSLTVNLSDAEVNVQQSTTEKFQVGTTVAQTAGTCEIDSVCFDENRVTFNANLALNTESAETTVTGTLTVVPGSLVVDVSGTTTVDGVLLRSLELTGTTTIGGAETAVTLSCNQ